MQGPLMISSIFPAWNQRWKLLVMNMAFIIEVFSHIGLFGLCYFTEQWQVDRPWFWIVFVGGETWVYYFLEFFECMAGFNGSRLVIIGIAMIINPKY